MLITIKYIHDYYKISRITLINWEKQGLLKPYRTPGGVRRYKKEDIESLMGMLQEKPKPAVVCYARVSTLKQKEYLNNQIKRLNEYCKAKGYTNYKVISEIASGVNENRRGLRKLLNMVKRGEVSKLIIEEYEDRLARFGYKYLETYLSAFGVDIEIINGAPPNDIHKELAEDLIAIVTSFAARVYGARGGRDNAKQKT